MIFIDLKELWLMPKGDDGRVEKRKHMYMKNLIHTAPDGKFSLPVSGTEKKLGFTF